MLKYQGATQCSLKQSDLIDCTSNKFVPEVGAAAVASPGRVRELNTHSSSEADPSESLLPPVSIASIVLPFLCSDDSKSDTKMPERHIPTAPIPPAPSVVAPSTNITSPVDAPPGICRRAKQDIPIGRLYRTHPGRPCRALTTRKSVRPLPSHHYSSFGHSTSDHSSSGYSTSGHSLSIHTPPVTTIVDSSAPLRLIYPPLSRTSRYSEAYHHWRSALLSTMYPPIKFELSAKDSSSESSVGPSHKRSRSLAATVTSSILASGALVPSYVDLFLPRKRFRDS
nr:hypothetical protein [Tanacetum cinerariifolium]